MDGSWDKPEFVSNEPPAGFNDMGRGVQTHEGFFPGSGHGVVPLRGRGWLAARCRLSL